MREEKLAYRYAKALFDASLDQGLSTPVGEELEGLSGLLDGSPDFRRLVCDPMITSAVKADLFERLFRGRMQKLLVDFLVLLAARRRERTLIAVIKEYNRLVEMEAGVETAKVTSAIGLSSEQKQTLVERLSRYSGKKIRLVCETDRALRGGLVVRLGDLVLDGSIDTRLEMLRRTIAGA